VATWTDGCVVAVDGILVDSSATSPAAAMTQSLVSQNPLRSIATFPAYDYDLATGVTRMKSLGVRYYLTHGGRPAVDASGISGLAKVADAGPWQLWELTDHSLVEPLSDAPSVVEDVSEGQWIPATTGYFTTDTYGQIPLVQQGPGSWPRILVGQKPPRTPQPPVEVSDVTASSSSVSFRVSQTGVPVLIKVSAFPGWTVDGADGPYRATPNLLVVTPTSSTVTLTRSPTPLDRLAMGLLLAGVGCLGYAVVDAYRRRGRAAGSAAEADA
jgi:hypothetical protein